MSRSRNIKPGFFRNEVLVELPFEYRLLYIGTWMHADREGRFEDRPQKIKMELFPADNVDVDAGLQALHDKGFLVRYSIAGTAYCQIIAWARHQNPHHREQPSIIPAPGRPEACLGLDSGKPRTSRADSLFSDSLSSDSLIPPAKALEQQAARSSASRADRFMEFWNVYPVKKGRAAALQTWKARNLDVVADLIIADVRSRATEDRQWLDGYAPHGSTYVRALGWEDEIDRRAAPGQHPGRVSAVDQVQAAIAVRQAGAGIRPRANDCFDGKKYAGTPIDHLAPEFRAAVEEATGAAHAA